MCRALGHVVRDRSPVDPISPERPLRWRSLRGSRFRKAAGRGVSTGADVDRMVLGIQRDRTARRKKEIVRS